MSTRYFFLWCERCPTRIRIETEVPETSQWPDPEYSFPDSDGAASCQARPSRPGDDGLETADLCPACSSQLHDLDDLVASGEVPSNTFTPEAHATWRTKRR